MPSIPASNISTIQFNQDAFEQAATQIGLSERLSEDKLSKSYLAYREFITSEISHINSLEHVLKRKKMLMAAHAKLAEREDNPNLIEAQHLEQFFTLINALRDKQNALLEALYQPNPQVWAAHIAALQELNKQYMVLYEETKDSQFPMELDNALRGKNGMGLNSYLIMPVQRPPRYVMLLNELMKQVAAENADFVAKERLADAHETAKKMVEAANQAVDDWVKQKEVLPAIQLLENRLKSETKKGQKADILVVNGLINVIEMMKREKTTTLEQALNTQTARMNQKQAKALSKAFKRFDKESKQILGIGKNIDEILSRAQYSPIIKSNNVDQAIKHYQDRILAGRSADFDKSTQRKMRSSIKKHPAKLKLVDNFDGGAEQLLEEVSKAVEHGFKIQLDRSAVLALKKYSQSNPIIIPAFNSKGNRFHVKKTLELATMLAVMDIPILLDVKAQKYFDSLEKLPEKKLKHQEREELHEKQELQKLLNALDAKPSWERVQPLKFRSAPENGKPLSIQRQEAQQQPSRPNTRNTT